MRGDANNQPGKRGAVGPSRRHGAGAAGQMASAGWSPIVLGGSPLDFPVAP